ncbi:MAG: hypothetical protein Q7T82_20655 [Armatimonadota bacterium]|nr:hypothetical protein [Armatimonadota bacterium]
MKKQAYCEILENTELMLGTMRLTARDAGIASTSLDTAKALLLALEARRAGEPLECLTIDQYLEPVVLARPLESAESKESEATKA